MRVVVVTHFASPYQAELFNAVSALNKAKLQVVYLHRLFPDRFWTPPVVSHDAIFLDEQPNLASKVLHNVRDADLAVFSYYAETLARELLNARARDNKAWCYWGERPGFKKPEWVSKLVRRWKLSWLHESKAPIWGIGEFAVDGYKREFGANRYCANLPYFSDLKRFQQLTRSANGKRERVFLFSGSLIHRKGVDLLAQAFLRLADEFENVRLKIMGGGELTGSLKEMLLPISSRVDFLGFKDWNELPDQYLTADILCVPSRYDGWGLVVPEGLAAGLPVIATDRMGAALEFIETKRNGWLIPAGDQHSLLNALREAASLSKEQLFLLSTQARDTVRNHSLEQGARRFLQYANEAVANWQVH